MAELPNPSDISTPTPTPPSMVPLFAGLVAIVLLVIAAFLFMWTRSDQVPVPPTPPILQEIIPTDEPPVEDLPLEASEAAEANPFEETPVNPFEGL
jgi:hypothetical protein